MNKPANKNLVKYSIVAIVFGVVVGLGWFAYDKVQQLEEQTTLNQELVEQFAAEKEELTDEYTQLSLQYESYILKVNNDSLEQKLEDQRIRMQQLVDELKQTKAEDARKIAELKKELKTVREVLKYYVAQVDSLNQVNEALVAENRQVREQMTRMSNANASLQEENKNLSQKVDIASHLTAQGLRAIALNKRDKETNSLKTTTTFLISFSISPNVTAQPGEKDLYVRILKPNEDLLINEKSGQFKYDGNMIQYSAKKVVEYTGEELPVKMYWNRKETLDPGTYTFEVYADGKLMGKCSLSMKK